MTASASNGLKSRARGFSLIEVLVVLALLGLSTVLVGYAVQPIRERNLLVRSLAELEDMLVRTREDAVSSGSPRRLAVDLRARRVAIEGSGVAVHLPGEVALAFEAAREVGTGEEPAVLFLPDGTSSGGRMVLRIGDNARALRISWLTGVVSREP